jgi:hypothetical protein
MTEAATREIDALAQAADASGAFISLVAESEMTLSASHKVLAAIAASQELLHNPDRLSFPAGILNFESSCGVCDSWGWARVGRRDCGGQAMMDACWARLVIAAL